MIQPVRLGKVQPLLEHFFQRQRNAQGRVFERFVGAKAGVVVYREKNADGGQREQHEPAGLYIVLKVLAIKYNLFSAVKAR